MTILQRKSCRACRLSLIHIFAQTVSATYGTGGNNQPFVVESPVVPATLKIRCGHGNGGRGALIQENKSATLSCNNDQTLFVPKAYGICGKYSNSMLSNNPNSGFYEAETSRTIDTSNQSPCKNQGGIVVLEGNGSRPSHHGDGYKESETMYTLNCTENHAVSYGIGRPAMNQMCIRDRCRESRSAMRRSGASAFAGTYPTSSHPTPMR